MTKIFRLTLRLFLLALALPILNSTPARANGVSVDIDSGQPLSGRVYDTIPNGGYDDYYIYLPNSAALAVAFNNTGTPAFDPIIQVYDPSGTYENTCSYGTMLECRFAYSGDPGMWKVRVSHWGGGLTGGNYIGTVVVVPADTSISSGNAGGVMTPSDVYSGDVNYGAIDVYRFQGQAGANFSANLTLTGTGSWLPSTVIFNSSGSYVGTTSVVGTAMQNDVYSVIVYKWGGTSTQTSYTISVSGTGVWPAPGSEDTELGVLMEPEVGHGETEVYAGVQA
jgi:hypothetical protein